MLAEKPLAPRPSGGKILHRAEPVGQSVCLEEGARRRMPALLRDRQGAQEVAGADRDKTLGKALEKSQGPLRLPVDQRRGGRQQEHVAVVGAGPYRLLRQWQAFQGPIRIGDRLAQDLRPRARLVWLVAKRQIRLFGGHANSHPLGLSAIQRGRDSAAMFMMLAPGGARGNAWRLPWRLPAETTVIVLWMTPSQA
jgi:hypothetical protein